MFRVILFIGYQWKFTASPEGCMLLVQLGNQFKTGAINWRITAWALQANAQGPPAGAAPSGKKEEKNVMTVRKKLRETEKNGHIVGYIILQVNHNQKWMLEGAPGKQIFYRSQSCRSSASVVEFTTPTSRRSTAASFSFFAVCSLPKKGTPKPVHAQGPPRGLIRP